MQSRIFWARSCFIITAMEKANRRVIIAGMLCLAAGLAAAQERSPQSVRDEVSEYRQQNEAEIVHSYAQLLSLPNVASDTANIIGNADNISAMLKQRGFRTQALNVSGAPPAVYGELTAPGAKHTLLFYAHYDGQPVDKAQWAGDPWQAVLRDGPVDGKTIPLESLKSPLNPEWRI